MIKEKSAKTEKDEFCMSLKVQIADAVNTYNVALHTLKEKGYKIWFEYDDNDTVDYGLWYAEKNERRFIASDPLRLLGIEAMHAHMGDEWRSKAHQYSDIYGKMLKS